jgi:hypothetical protein
MNSTWHYKARFTIPVTLDVQVIEFGLGVDKAPDVLKAKAKKLLDERYGHVLGMEYCELKMVPCSLEGTFISDGDATKKEKL